MMLDTTYVVDLHRERMAGLRGAATLFLEGHQSVKLRMPLFVLCELQLGVARSSNPYRERRALGVLTEFVEPVYPESGYSEIHAQIVSALLSAGTPIPVMDSLIAAIAIQHAEPLVTRDTEHFSLIDGLVVLDYATSRPDK